MNSRERVLLALNHREPDRVPIDLGATIVSSITKSAYIDLARYLGIPVEPVQILDTVQQLPYLSEELLRRFDVDFRMVCLPPAMAPDPGIFDDGDYVALVDRWGSRMRMPKKGGLYFDWVSFPIQSPGDPYEMPPLDSGEHTVRLAEQARWLAENTDYALAGSAIIGGGVFEQPARIMGMENFLMSLVGEPEAADRFMGRLTDLYIESSNRYLDALGQYIQVFVYWDDVCGQNGWLVSPSTYRKLIKPKQARLVEAIKKKTNAKVFYHGCGAAFDLIPHLIEIGFDIINPVQVAARGMDTRRLKQEYGRDIVFWGGGVDTQSVLPFGKPAEVAAEVRRRVEDLAPGGGFIFSAVHNVQAYVPPENIVTAFDTALECGRYR